MLLGRRARRRRPLPGRHLAHGLLPGDPPTRRTPSIPRANPLVNVLTITLRRLSRSPGFTTVAIGTVGLCLAANLVVFAVVDAVLLRPLPFPEPERLVTLYNSYPRIGRERGASSYLNYHSRRDAIPAFERIAAFSHATAIVGDAGSTEAVPITQVSPEFFDTLGVKPFVGRVFTEAEMTYATDGVVILTEAFRREHFGEESDVIGRTLRIQGAPRTIVGVLPRAFRFLSSHARLYVPLSTDKDRLRIERLHNGGFEIIARLASGRSTTEAQSQIDAHNTRMNREFPYAKDVAEAGFRTVVASLHGEHVRSIRTTLWLLQGGVVCLLLIGGVNLANLLWIRAGSRGSEWAVRQWLGAGPVRLAGQALTETAVLAAAGGVLGVVLAAAGLRLLSLLGVDQLPLGTEVGLTPRLAVLALVATGILALACALPAAWMGILGGARRGWENASRTTTHAKTTLRLRHTFLVAQVALAWILLSGAGLLGVSLKKALAVSPGFRPEHTLSGRITLPWTHYKDDTSRLDFAERLIETLKAQPGIVAAGASSDVPMNGNREFNAMRIPGHVPELASPPILHGRHGVTGAYFEAMGIPLREGRYLEAADSRRPRRVCVVDDEFARTYWPGRSALGQTVSEGPDPRDPSEWFTIVGVVGAVKQTQLTEATPGRSLYLPYRHNPSPDIYVTVRTSSEPGAFGLALQKLVRSIDPELPVTDLKTMRARIDDSLIDRRSAAILAGIFAFVAVALAAIGTYGVLAYAVAQRRREIGVRMAVGALPGRIARDFLAAGMRVLLVGGILGGAGAMLLGRSMRTMLFDVPDFHAPVFLLVPVAMTLVSLAASLVPALRAARTDPIRALRAE